MRKNGTKDLYMTGTFDFYLPADSPDAFECFDAERIVNEITGSGANLVVIFALNQEGYAYYPSEVVPPHPMLRT